MKAFDGKRWTWKIETYKVTQVAEESVTFSQESTLGNKPFKRDRDYPRVGEVMLESFMSFLSESDRISGVDIRDDTKTVRGRTFHCMRASFKQIESSEHGGKWSIDRTARVVMWFSKEVKGLGLVAQTLKYEDRVDRNAIDFSSEVEVAGYGTGDYVDWGKAPRFLPDADDSSTEGK